MCARFACSKASRSGILAVLLLTTNLAQAAWYDSNWSYRKRITIDSAQVAGNLSNFPILINLATDPDLVAKARTDGFDILFTDDDETTKLDHEIETFVSGTGELVAWVEVPSLPAAVDKVIYLYHGYPSSPDQQDVEGTWDANFDAVWHLHDDFLDSTMNNNDGTNNGSTDISGHSADGQDFDGSNDYVDLTSKHVIDVSHGLSPRFFRSPPLPENVSEKFALLLAPVDLRFSAGSLCC